MDNYQEDIISLLNTKKEAFWAEAQKKQALAVFHKAAKRVPAYADFLKKNSINPTHIQTWDDFQHVPPTSKKNYLRQYPLEELSWDGTLAKPMVFTATSGSTGEPFYFMRDENLDFQYSFILESFLREVQPKPTLVVVCFGMGLWIGGLITYKAYEILAKRKNYPLSIITPGLSKKEILKILKNLSPQFGQTILIGYAPFIKEVVDEAKSAGVDLPSLHVRFHFAAEAITEEYRNYLAKHASVHSVYTDFINIYGSADIGAMAVENPISILVKRECQKNKELFQSIFSSIDKTPTIAQYNPLFISFESMNGEILLTGDSTLPLVRYSIGDHGGTLRFSQVSQAMKDQGIDLRKLAKEKGIKEFYELPFVYVYERADLSASLYGLLIYPEWVKTVLFSDPINKYLTGKFTMITRNNQKQDQYLEINLELKKDVTISQSLHDTILHAIIQGLQKNSSEYRELSDKIKDKAWPQLKFWDNGDSLYFTSGIKQKWTLK